MSACIDFVLGLKIAFFRKKGAFTSYVDKTRWVDDTGKVGRFSLVKVKELFNKCQPGIGCQIRPKPYQRSSRMPAKKIKRPSKLSS